MSIEMGIKLTKAVRGLKGFDAGFYAGPAEIVPICTRPAGEAHVGSAASFEQSAGR